MKVLVVDDNRDLADLIKNVLEDEGMEVMSANDATEGYAAYLFFKPDLVFTDVQMPGGTGFDMMCNIRAHDPMIRTVYMSGNIDTHQLTLEWEMQRYPVTVLRKPFPLKLLLKLVAEQGSGRPMGDTAILHQRSHQQPTDGLPSS